MKVGCRRIIGRGFSCCTCTTVDARMRLYFIFIINILQYFVFPA